ncbi:dihydroxyacetone kinase subunit DhaK [Vagococcus silagei]|uniref:dihydroxyacetone kinase subunit DhaK n=1 Tax=Vagococcus silagei TaxID=2508885 RepID=UPI00194E6FEF|nr:dihydroxyacetone kinase subunit DhaK [Vagococcus silagei]
MLIINKPEDVSDQVLQGATFLHSDIIEKIPNSNIIVQKHFSKNQVALIGGGGIGHEPSDFGFVGDGMLTACVNGKIFQPAPAKEILRAIKSVYTKYGVLIIIKNFERDLNVCLEAEKLAREEGMQVDHVIVNDDCSIEKRDNYKKRRRGVSGTVLVHKILGAAAKEGKSLAELKEIGDKVVYAMNTLGVATASGTCIETPNKPLFELPEQHISYGVGIHGEAGYRVEPFRSSENLANELLNKLIDFYDVNEESQFAILINGMGATTAMELAIFAHDVSRLSVLNELNISFVKAGSFLTSTNMSGVSLTLLKLQENSWLRFLEAPTSAFAW